MQHPRRRFHPWRLFVLACLLAVFITHGDAGAAEDSRRSIVPMLADQLGLSEQQVRGALGALLVFVREELPKPEFDELAKTIPNADRIMQDVKQSGIVTRPLDDVSEFEESLSMLGIGQPLASQFAPAVVQALGAAGHDRERDILARALN